jgi:RimJ/RimL family protein N-acetyltransferase
LSTPAHPQVTQTVSPQFCIIQEKIMPQHTIAEQTLQDGTIELRPPTESDMQFIRWLWSDPETMQPVGGPIHLTDEQAQHWFAKMIKPGRPTDCYRLVFNEKNEPVGEISFHRLNSVTMTAEFNVKIAHTQRGKSYAKKAMILFLDFYFNQVGGQVMVDDIACDNDQGQQVLLKFGYEHDPSRTDVFRVKMTRDRYNRLYPSPGVHPKWAAG